MGAAAAAGAREPFVQSLLVVSAGFDYVAGDAVGDLGVGVEAAAPIAAAIRRAAERILRRIASHTFWKADTTSMR